MHRKATISKNGREPCVPSIEKENGRARQPGPILPFTRRKKVCQFEFKSGFLPSIIAQQDIYRVI
jgi:hypothetical protein